MSRKSKGINAERNLLHKFWTVGYACCRIAGSGSNKYPSADLIASNKLRRMVIECKTSASESKYFTKEEVEQLRIFANLFGAEPWIAMRFDRKEWHFLNPDDLRVTDTGFAIDLELIKNKGLLFEEVIK